MAGENSEFDAMASKWRGLIPSDRQAVLQRLSPERRDIFLRLIAAADEEAGLAPARAPRFQGLSSWLAELVEASERGTAQAKGLKPLVRTALVSGHELTTGLAAAPSPLRSIIQALLTRLRALL